MIQMIETPEGQTELRIDGEFCGSFDTPREAHLKLREIQGYQLAAHRAMGDRLHRRH